MSNALFFRKAEIKVIDPRVLAMNEEALIAAVRTRASNPKTRTDNADRWPIDLAIPATPDQVRHAEQLLGCKFHPLFHPVLDSSASPPVPYSATPPSQLSAIMPR